MRRMIMKCSTFLHHPILLLVSWTESYLLRNCVLQVIEIQISDGSVTKAKATLLVYADI